MDKKIAVIPARGGSKRIPLKNIKFFLGKPIIAYSIEVARQSGLFDEIIVSTDNGDIAAVAASFGAKVPFMRSSENASDTAPLNDTVKEVMAYYEKKGEHFDYFCCILPTAPFITVELLQQGYELIASGNYRSVRPVVPYSYPIQRAIRIDNAGYMQFISPENYYTRSQDLETSYHDSGTFYWICRGYDLSDQAGKGAFGIAPILAQDIDTLEDWGIAEFKYEYLKGKKML